MNRDFLLIILCLMLCACTSATTNMSTPIVSLTPLATVRVESTNTPIPVPTVTPRPISSVTARPEPTPTATLNPVFSDVRIAYVSESKVWLWAEGISRTLFKTGERFSNVSISNDGEFVAFSTNTNRDLWLIKADGTGQRLLVKAEQLNPETPERGPAMICQLGWIPNTHKIFLSTGNCTVFGPWLDDLYLFDIDTNQLTELLPKGEGGQALPSPDGGALAIASRTKVTVVLLDSLSRHTVYKYEMLQYSGDVAIYPSIAWRSDSASFVASIYTNRCTKADETVPECQYRVVEILDVGLGQLPTFQRLELNADLFSVELAPDGTQVAYWQRSNDATRSYDLHVLSIDGLTGQMLPGPGEIRSSGWLPDSTGFLFYEATNSQPLIVTGSEVTVYETILPTASNIIWIDESFVMAETDGDILLCENEEMCFQALSSVDSYSFAIMDSR
jgi:hypothetical protein